jgi:hypothetical protein
MRGPERAGDVLEILHPLPRRVQFQVVLKRPTRPGRFARLRRRSRNIVLAAFAYLCHPKGMTCLHCGFLALGDGEVSTADRVLLGANGEGGCPPLNKLHCTRKLWVEYDLMYFDTSRDGLFAELHKRRRPCVGFLLYRPGWSPSEHRDLLRTKIDRRTQIVISAASAVGASGLTLLGAWLLKLLRLK